MASSENVQVQTSVGLVNGVILSLGRILISVVGVVATCRRSAIQHIV